MLVLSRREGEEIYVGDGIRIVVLKVQRGRTRLGIDCSRAIAVRRGEVEYEIEVGQHEVEVDTSEDEVESASPIAAAYSCHLCGGDHSDRRCRANSEKRTEDIGSAVTAGRSE